MKMMLTTVLTSAYLAEIYFRLFSRMLLV